MNKRGRMQAHDAVGQVIGSIKELVEGHSFEDVKWAIEAWIETQPLLGDMRETWPHDAETEVAIMYVLPLLKMTAQQRYHRMKELGWLKEVKDEEK